MMPRVDQTRYCQNTPARAHLRTSHWRTVGLAAALLVVMVVQPGAQTAQGTRLSEDPLGRTTMATNQVDLLVGRSTVLTLPRPISRVSLSMPEIADALVTSTRQVLIHGKAPGTISLLLWDDNAAIQSYEVVVRRDLSPLKERLAQLFPSEPIAIASNGTDVVISGTVTTKHVIEQAAAVAAGYVEKPENVVNLLRQQEGVATSQILLRVRFAEVSRSAVQELGASFFTGINGSGNWVARGTTQQFAAPVFDERDGLVFSDFLNIFAFHTGESIGTVVRALETKGLFESLAEPNLITQNGKEATFLAGGEYPYPVVQGSANNAAVTIMFKEFGVRLRFTPTIVGDDLINLQVAPEVSALDFSNAITLEGFRVPALSTRRTETEVELRDGQTFAIAGLLDNTVTETMSKVPGLGDVPILGYLFRSRAYQKNQTELVVMITPHIVRRDSDGVTNTMPGFTRPFIESDDERLPHPPPYPQGTSMYERPGSSELVAGNRVIMGPDGTIVTSDGDTPAASGAAPGRGESDVAAARRLAEERKMTEAALKEAREQAKRESKEAERLAKAERDRIDDDRKAAETAREAAERQAQEAARRAAEEAAAEAERLAKAERARFEAEQRRAEAEQERLAAERKAAAERAKRQAEQAERLAKADRERLEDEREAAEKAREEDLRMARAAQQRAYELEQERAERERELQRVLDEYLEKIDEAQRAVQELDAERANMDERRGAPTR